MSSTQDFEIEDGILKKYTGSCGDVEIPDSVTAIGDLAFQGCMLKAARTVRFCALLNVKLRL